MVMADINLNKPNSDTRCYNSSSLALLPLSH